MVNTHEGDRDRPVLFGDGTPRKVPHDMAVFVLAAAVVGMKLHVRFSVGLVFQVAVQHGDDGVTTMALTTVKTYVLSLAEREIRLLAEAVTDGKFDSFAMFFAYVANVCPRVMNYMSGKAVCHKETNERYFDTRCDEVCVADVPTPPPAGCPLLHASTYFACTDSGRLRHVQLSWTGDFGFWHFHSS